MGAVVITDGLASYNPLAPLGYQHVALNHTQGIYATTVTLKDADSTRTSIMWRAHGFR